MTAQDYQDSLPVFTNDCSVFNFDLDLCEKMSDKKCYINVEKVPKFGKQKAFKVKTCEPVPVPVTFDGSSCEI